MSMSIESVLMGTHCRLWIFLASILRCVALRQPMKISQYPISISAFGVEFSSIHMKMACLDLATTCIYVVKCSEGRKNKVPSVYFNVHDDMRYAACHVHLRLNILINSLRMELESFFFVFFFSMEMKNPRYIEKKLAIFSVGLFSPLTFSSTSQTERAEIIGCFSIIVQFLFMLLRWKMLNTTIFNCSFDWLFPKCHFIPETFRRTNIIAQFHNYYIHKIIIKRS